MKKIHKIIILSTLNLIVIGFLIEIFLIDGNNSFKDSKTITLKDETKEEMNVTLDNLYPGYVEEYSLNLKANKGDKYELSLKLSSNQKEVELAQYLMIKISINDETIAQGWLKEYLDGDYLSSVLEYKNENIKHIKVQYLMPEEIGNEAQGKEVIFNFIIIASRW